TPITAVIRMSRVRQVRLGAAVEARSRAVIGAVRPCTDPPGAMTPPSESENGANRAWACFLRRYEPDQVPRVCGLATLSARRRSPEAVFSCSTAYRTRLAGHSREGRLGLLVAAGDVAPADLLADPAGNVA